MRPSYRIISFVFSLSGSVRRLRFVFPPPSFLLHYRSAKNTGGGNAVLTCFAHLTALPYSAQLTQAKAVLRKVVWRGSLFLPWVVLFSVLYIWRTMVSFAVHPHQVSTCGTSEHGAGCSVRFAHEKAKCCENHFRVLLCTTDIIILRYFSMNLSIIPVSPCGWHDNFIVPTLFYKRSNLFT